MLLPANTLTWLLMAHVGSTPTVSCKSSCATTGTCVNFYSPGGKGVAIWFGAMFANDDSCGVIKEIHKMRMNMSRTSNR